ncbi:MAG: flippase [Phascolarctobacterium sp.]|nr:flippase [Phascolarctobacterium sp.]
MTSKNQKSIKLNFIMNAILTLSGFIFPLITFPYVSRILLPAGMGKVAMATSVVAYFALLARLGIPMYGIRACAGVRDDKQALSKMVHELFLINFLMAMVSYALFFGTVFFVPKLAEERLLYIIVSLTIFFEMLGVDWLYRALEEYAYITKCSLAFKVIAVVAMFVLIHEQSDYVVYGSITVLAACGSYLLNFYNLRKHISSSLFDNYNLKQHMTPILVFFATSCAIVIYTQLNTVMLGFLKSPADVGLYDSAMKIKNILVSFVTALGAVLLPRASYYVKNELYDDFARITSKAVQFVCLLAIPLVVYFTIFASDGIYFFSGPRFAGAIVPMQIIMPTVLFIGLTNIIGIQVLVPLGREKDVFYSVLVGGIVDLAVCALLIPGYGVVGAAAANMIAEFSVLVVQLILVAKYKDKVDIIKGLKTVSYSKIVVAIVLAVGASVGCKLLAWHAFFVLALSGTVFFAVYGLCLYVLKEKFLLEILVPVKAKLREKLGL